MLDKNAPLLKRLEYMFLDASFHRKFALITFLLAVLLSLYGRYAAYLQQTLAAGSIQLVDVSLATTTTTMNMTTTPTIPTGISADESNDGSHGNPSRIGHDNVGGESWLGDSSVTLESRRNVSHTEVRSEPAAAVVVAPEQKESPRDERGGEKPRQRGKEAAGTKNSAQKAVPANQKKKDLVTTTASDMGKRIW